MNGKNSSYLPAKIIQLVGLFLLIGAAIFWALTGRESVLLTSAAMSLILLGAYTGAIGELTRRNAPPDKDTQ